MSLVPAEPDQLALFTFEELEAVIERGLKTFVEVGRALMRIRDERLYRKRGYTDFDTYCRQRWSWTRRTIDRQIEAAQVAEIVRPIGLTPPANEAQARELVPLLDDEKALVEVWREVKETYGEKVTAEKIREAVDVVVRRDRIAEAALWQPPPATTPAMPTGRYRCIVIDPPWPVQKVVQERRPDQGVRLDYPTMTLDQIGALPVPDLADQAGTHVYLWVTHKLLPAGLELFQRWSIRYQCLLTWCKPSGVSPFSWMYDTEHVLFGRAGNDLPLNQMGLRLSFTAPTVRDGHSTKPDAFYDRVRTASPGPRLEMFARQPREGFDVWGNEVTDAGQV